jgi:hypothetical protein
LMLKDESPFWLSWTWFLTYIETFKETKITRNQPWALDLADSSKAEGIVAILPSWIDFNVAEMDTMTSPEMSPRHHRNLFRSALIEALRLQEEWVDRIGRGISGDIAARSKKFKNVWSAI